MFSRRVCRCSEGSDYVSGDAVECISRPSSFGRQPVGSMVKVSVCVPTYNGCPFVELAVQSILAQSFHDFELIVSDDFSTDATPREVARIAGERLSLSGNPRRLGLVGNWNRCLELATGQYVQIFHQDDLMLPNCVERMASVLDTNPNVGFVFANIRTINAAGEVVGPHWTKRLPSVDTIFSGGDFIRLLLREGNLVACPSAMARASVLRSVGPFDESLRYTPDLEMWLRLALHCDVAYIAEPLVLLRRHARQESSHFSGMTHEVDEVWRAFRVFFQDQRALIPDREALHSIALDYLLHWTYEFFRESLRASRYREALQFGRRWVDFAWAKRVGLDRSMASRIGPTHKILRIPAERLGEQFATSERRSSDL